MDLVAFADLGCGGAGPMIGINTRIDWDWECRIGDVYISVVKLLDDDMEVYKGSVNFSCSNGYGLFVNILLKFGEIAIGQFSGGRCYFGHAGV